MVLFHIKKKIVIFNTFRLQLKFSHLSKDKFRHKFKYCVSPLGNRGTGIKTTKKIFSCVANSLPVIDIISMASFI